MRKSVLVVLLFIIGSRAAAQGVDSTCLVLWQYTPLCPCSTDPSFFWINDDSVKVDMCPHDPHYLQEYAKNEFDAAFQNYIIPSDSLLDSDTVVRTWQEVDTIYPSLRACLDSLEKWFGYFTLQYKAGDNRVWWINFARYVNVVEVDSALDSLPDLNPLLGAEFAGHPGGYQAVSSDTPQITRIKVWPEPAHSELNMSGLGTRVDIKFFDPLGRELTFPVSRSDGILTVDISRQPDGVIYCAASGDLFKIIIQR